jgi:hypothetical protein
MEVKVNSVAVETFKPEYTKLYDKERGLSGDQNVYAMVLPQNVLKKGYNTIEINQNGGDDFSVLRVELALKYGDVETHGYF